MASPHRLIGLLLVVMSGACSNDDPKTIRIDFAAGTTGWNAGFADYPVGEDAFFELEADYGPLMPPLNVGQNAHYITGNNYSDDLWMYYKGQVAGLDGNRRYSVRFDIEIATNVPTGCFGVGGAPGRRRHRESWCVGESSQKPWSSAPIGV